MWEHVPSFSQPHGMRKVETLEKMARDKDKTQAKNQGSDQR